jgi:hypothetical protein
MDKPWWGRNGERLKGWKVVCKLMHCWLYGRLAKPFWARWPGVEKKSLNSYDSRRHRPQTLLDSHGLSIRLSSPHTNSLSLWTRAIVNLVQTDCIGKYVHLQEFPICTRKAATMGETNGILQNRPPAARYLTIQLMQFSSRSLQV